MEDSDPNEPIPKSAKAKDYHQRVWLPRASKGLSEMRSLPVTVFVCGPTEQSQALTRKKIDTVNALRKLGHDASLGEELVAELSKQDNDAGNSIQTANTYELIAASKSDLIVVFCASPGSIGETHEFLSVSTIGQKTLIFIDEQYSNSYTAVGILSSHKKLRRPLETYKSPEDIDNCTLMGKVIDWVQNYQSARWISTLREE
ncbi:MAG: hypothetical protein HY529_01615 [Chloroflexi bacterium]|nr:hypothetical protein [Chloroflexota bacterium]